LTLARRADDHGFGGDHDGLMVDTRSLRDTLEFGVFDWLDVAAGRDTAALYDDRLALVRRADVGAFSRYHLAEHHGSPLGLASSPAVFLAAVAALTQRIRLVPTTFILPFYDPLRLAQEIGMLDQLSHGRLEIGIGKGSSPYEAAMMGLSKEDTAERFELVLPAILESLETGVFTPPREGAEPIELFVKPSAVPPLWYPTSNAASIPITARKGHHTIFGFGFTSPPLEDIRTHADAYFATRAEADAASGTESGDVPRFGILRHVVVAGTDAEALELATQAFADHQTNFVHLWRKNGSDRNATDRTISELVEGGLFFAGSPQTVADQVAHAVEVSGVNYFAGAFAFGSLSREASLHSMDLYDNHVIPAVNDRFGGRLPATA
jgi:alkanesulfonate monooxygenase SsuD/methylene tetrahydromethanopterin reductase-like flavin-dependent oxidoreductase (luciferase family)